MGYKNTITHNEARDNGGALYLVHTQIYGDSGSNFLTFSNNAVIHGKGGAIFVLDEHCDILSFPQHRCFIEYFFLDGIALSFVFENNSASRGSVLFGGLLDRCLQPSWEEHIPLVNYTGMEVFKEISSYESTPLAFSSNPVTVCACSNNSKPDCTVREISTSRPRGGIVIIGLIAFDQDRNPVPGFMRASYKEIPAQLERGEAYREISNYQCNDLKYISHLHS